MQVCLPLFAELHLSRISSLLSNGLDDDSFSELPIEFAVEEARPAAKVNPAIDDGQDDLVMQQEIFDVCISVVPGLSGDGDRRDFLPCEGRKWGKIRPAGTISREGMRYHSLQSLNEQHYQTFPNTSSTKAGQVQPIFSYTFLGAWRWLCAKFRIASAARL
jgi:hypothetical protein